MLALRVARVSPRGRLCTAVASSLAWTAALGQRRAASRQVVAAATAAAAAMLAPASAAERYTCTHHGNRPVAP
jgi:hypothetical protein